MKPVESGSRTLRPATLTLPRIGGVAGLVGFLLIGVGLAVPDGVGRIALVAGWLGAVAFWVGLYALLRERRPPLALLGAAGGLLSSALEIAAALTGVHSGGVLTALRVPRVGGMSLALFDGPALRRVLAWWGLLVAALTVVELALWVTRGSPNDPLPVGFAAASLGTLWELVVAAWLAAGAGASRAWR